MKRLIVTADDFGAAHEVNEAVETAHRHGILTAASLMVSGAAAADAVVRARHMPQLRVGLHLVLVEGRPTLPASQVSRLVGADGLFRSDMASLGAEIAFSPRARSQLIAEITAQFEAFAATGLALDHCNAHKHFHLHPSIGRMMASIGSRFGVRAVRVPEEPLSVLREIEPSTARAPALITAPFAWLLKRQLRAAGLAYPDRVFGLHWSGAMTRPRLAGLLRHLPEGLTEVYLHPATGAYAGSAPGYRYRDEMDALTSADIVHAVRSGSVGLGGFADFAGSPDADQHSLRQWAARRSC
ncbi:MAG: hopanoid biosynthesis-associated protein HpnK [Steroidobacteraceae bacterium]